MIVQAWMALAVAGNGNAAEEIFVWGDRFARWERRWYVETQIDYATTQLLFAWNNYQVELGAVQIRAVLDCDKDFPQARNQWEVSCEIEDIGFVALPGRRPGKAAARVVLDEIDATLTGALVQMQVGAGGSVPNLDLEGVETTNRRSRERLEQLRQLMLRVMLPFHLRLPDPVYDGARWYEYDSRLMSMPSGLGSVGGATMVHYLDAFEDQLVVQTLGKAILTPGLGDSFYEINAHGVAVFDPLTGIMTERVWSLGGGPTASSLAALTGQTYGHTGRLRMLGESDRPHVGATVWADLDTWVPIQP